MTIRLLLASLLAIASGLMAQSPNPLVTTETQRYFTSIRRNLEASAEAMPADKYGFKLTEGQMSFGEWMIHAAQRNFADCASLKGETAPQTTEQLAALKDKPAVSKAVKDSFTYCAAVVAGLDDAKVLSSPQNVYSFLHLVVHNNEI